MAAGAERVILCDTNGGTMPWEIKNICEMVQKECPGAARYPCAQRL